MLVSLWSSCLSRLFFISKKSFGTAQMTPSAPAYILCHLIILWIFIYILHIITAKCMLIMRRPISRMSFPPLSAHLSPPPINEEHSHKNNLPLPFIFFPGAINALSLNACQSTGESNRSMVVWIRRVRVCLLQRHLPYQTKTPERGEMRNSRRGSRRHVQKLPGLNQNE